MTLIWFLAVLITLTTFERGERPPYLLWDNFYLIYLNLYLSRDYIDAQSYGSGVVPQ